MSDPRPVGDIQPGGRPLVWSVVVAAGSGSRFGGAKQYESLGGRRVLDWSVAAARAATDGVVLVVHPSQIGRTEASADACVVGGTTRSASVRAGLLVVPIEVDVIVVHDAARPIASAELFAAVIAAVAGGADAAVPGVPVVDTLRWRTGRTVDRDRLVAVQTPQAFRAAALRMAHDHGAEASDDATLVEGTGGRVVVVEGEPRNRKITDQADLALVESLLR